MTPAPGRARPPTAQVPEAGASPGWSWWSPLPLVAAARGPRRDGHQPRIEERLGAVVRGERWGARPLPPARLAGLAELACAGLRLERLVHDLLHDPRDGPNLRPERRDALATVRDAVAALSVAQHTLELTLPDEPVVRCLDHEVLIRIVTNLVGNAMKHTPSGSRIAVAMRPLPTGLELSVTTTDPGCRRRTGRGPSTSTGAGAPVVARDWVSASTSCDASQRRTAERPRWRISPAGACRFTVRLEELPVAMAAPALAR